MIIFIYLYMNYNDYNTQKLRGLKRKLELIKSRGGKCELCGKRFPKSKGKIYCSKECRDADKHYPSLEEVNEQYEILKNWEKVAQHFGLTRRVIQGIRKKDS